MENHDKIAEAIRDGRCVLLSGPAGTGKSYTLNKFFENYSKMQVHYCALTGCASTVLPNATTLHKFLSLGVGKDLYDYQKIKSSSNFKKKINYIKSLDAIIIDECSMLRGDTLALVEALIKFCMLHGIQDSEAIERIKSLPFGGKSIIFTGDMMQIGPIVKREEMASPHLKNGPWIFQSDVWRAIEPDMEIIYLREVKRTSDIDFINALNRIRIGHATVDDIKFFRDTQNKEVVNPIYLVATNKEADDINNERLKSINAQKFVNFAELSGDADEVQYLIKDILAPEILELKIGARVMILKNDTSENQEYVNGSIGEFMGACNDAVSFIDGNMKLVDGLIINIDGNEVKVPKNMWTRTKSEIVEVFDEETGQLVKSRSEEVVASFEQFPVKLCYAQSIHKSQGQSLDAVIIDANKFFAEGQAYVALSRCRSFKNLKVLNFNQSKIKINKDAYGFYKRLADEGRL